MFDKKKLIANRIKNASNLSESAFYQFLSEDLIDRIRSLDCSIKKVLIIENNVDFFAKHLKEIDPEIQSYILEDVENIDQANFSVQSGINALSNQNDPIGDVKFDLIIFLFGLHWVNDIQSVLKALYDILGDHGILVANFAGGETLRSLRKTIIMLEHEEEKEHNIHIPPFIQFEHVPILLQQAGFVENIIDIEKIELEHKNPLELMKFLKKIGEGNVMVNSIKYSLTKSMHSKLSALREYPFVDAVNLVTFMCSKFKKTIRLKQENS